MKLNPIPVVDSISPEDFRKNYYEPMRPVVIKDMAKNWPAYQKWNWQYFRELVGDKRVGIYNNVKSDSHTPVNTADAYTSFGEYIDMVSSGPAQWRIFLFNILAHAPQLLKDFTWPEDLMKGFIKKYPVLFVGGQTSITHMHFDIDHSHVFHTQFSGKKRLLLFPFEEQCKLYRKPWETLSLADFSNYYDPGKSKLNFEQFPAIQLAEGYDFILGHGDTLFMPAGYWHHMEYLESSFSMSLRAMQPTLSGKLKGAWSLIGMRNIDTLMKKTAPHWWYDYKRNKLYERAAMALRNTAMK